MAERPALPLLFDITGRGEIVLRGKDRAEFLQGLVTNDVKRLTPGTGCYAAFLTPKGKMLADLVVLCADDEIVLDCEPGLAGKIEALLHKYHFFHEVTIESRTEATGLLHVAGEGAKEAVGSLLEGLSSLPSEPHVHVVARLRASTAMARIVMEQRAGSPGFDLRLTRDDVPAALASLASAGLTPSSLNLLETLRIQAGIPRWGFELDETVLPDEAGLAARGALSYTKGCYIGQEIVARIKTYGHVNRTLVRLEVEGEAPAPGSEVCFEGEKAGRVTSSVSVAGGRGVALAYVKREHGSAGTRFTVQAVSGSIAAEIVPAALG